tara:strand:- start:307 stop:558 length:252 start_codon:yes stop_codon:yes gene_type:complete
LKIFYFAELREFLGKNEDDIDISSKTKISDVLEKLKSEDKKYKEAFKKVKNIRCAVNCEYVESFDYEVINSDEIAFFPPVTGG